MKLQCTNLQLAVYATVIGLFLSPLLMTAACRTPEDMESPMQVDQSTLYELPPRGWIQMIEVDGVRCAVVRAKGYDGVAIDCDWPAQ